MVLLVAYAFYCVEMCNLYGFIITLYISPHATRKTVVSYTPEHSNETSTCRVPLQSATPRRRSWRRSLGVVWGVHF